MSVPDFSDISKPSDGRVAPKFATVPLPLPAYTDLAKSANDVSWSNT